MSSRLARAVMASSGSPKACLLRKSRSSQTHVLLTNLQPLNKVLPPHPPLRQASDSIHSLALVRGANHIAMSSASKSFASLAVKRHQYFAKLRDTITGLLLRFAAEDHYIFLSLITDTPNTAVSPSSTPTTPTPSSVRPARAYAKNISETYALKLQHGDFTIDVQDRAVTESYRILAASKHKAYWFIADNTPPSSFEVTVPYFPFFHPKDDLAITTVIGEQHCHTYSVLDLTHPALTLDYQPWVITRGPLRYLEPAKTRRMSDASPSPSPTKVSRSSSAFSSSVVARTSHSASSSFLSQGVIDVSDTDDDVSALASSQDPFLIPTPTPRKTTPTPRKMTPWPLKYTVDMDLGFSAMDKHSGVAIDAFTDAFPKSKFASTTYYAHRKAWTHLDAGAIADRVKIGRAPGGEWKPLYKSYIPTVDIVQEILKFFYKKSHPSRQNLATALAAVDQENIVIDWAYVCQEPAANSEERATDNYIQQLFHANTVSLPEGLVLPELIARSTIQPPLRKHVVPVIDSEKWSTKDWNIYKLWKFILRDSRRPSVVNLPRVLAIDETDLYEDNGSGPTSMHRFNKLRVHLYTQEPDAAHLDKDQEIPADAGLVMAKTKTVLEDLFSIWRPSNSTSPFTVSYALPGFGTDPVLLYTFDRGLHTADDNFPASAWAQAQWSPALKTHRSDHYLPILGPPDALRILFYFQIYELPASTATPVTTPVVVPPVILAPSIGPPPPAPAPAPATSILTKGQARANQKAAAATAWMLAKYGGRTALQQLRQTAMLEPGEPDSASAASDTAKSQKKGKQSCSVIVEWAACVGDIIKKHQHQSYPAELNLQGKFTQKSFEDLFGRLSPWINTACEIDTLMKHKEMKYSVAAFANLMESIEDPNAEPVGLSRFLAYLKTQEPDIE
ncbi:hypothetical protein GGX14DRAFT_390985 [Mycena pura]|uniref:Uncharacterized protein n=1 Tax=Mycena pura TaxID=153505 RepID=A0AAD6VQS6_9AGAR|nr:hypothetical protein GGX14DRAFT_390985 [Mycena pura]